LVRALVFFIGVFLDLLIGVLGTLRVHKVTCAQIFEFQENRCEPFLSHDLLGLLGCEDLGGLDDLPLLI
jgi:hypothetical protein